MSLVPTACWESEALRVSKVFKASLDLLELQGLEDLKDNGVFLVRRAVRVTPVFQGSPENLDFRVYQD